LPTLMSKLLYEKRDRIAYLTINRPDAKNAIDPDTHQLLWEAWEDFRDDDSVDVAILTGAGDAFCAGADLKTYIPPIIQGSSPRWVRDNAATGLGGLTRGLHRIYKPTIAAVNGWALAGGLELALACDIRVASERAMFGSFEARRGYHHGDGGIVRLVNTCGAGIALELLLTAEPIDAERALRANLVSRVVPHDELLAAAEGVAASILRNSQVAVRTGTPAPTPRRRWAGFSSSTTAPTRAAPRSPAGANRATPGPRRGCAALAAQWPGHPFPPDGADSGWVPFTPRWKDDLPTPRKPTGVG
jgi:enoyl-CoA hydratase/carnithine racemase